jgi:hypothetical protein
MCSAGYLCRLPTSVIPMLDGRWWKNGNEVVVFAMGKAVAEL